MASTDGRTTTVATRVELGGQPCGVAVVGAVVWVTDTQAAELVKVDGVAGRVLARYPVSASPCEVEAAAGSLWVTTQSGVVDRVDPETGKVLASVETGAASYETIGALGSVWVSNRNGRSVTRIAPATNSPTTRPVGEVNAGGIVEEGGFLWLGDDTTGASSILRIDPRTWRTTAVPTGGDRPGYVAATPGRVWVSNVKSGTVTGLDATTLAPVGPPTPAGASPVNLKASADGAWVWVPDDVSDLVTRIDAGSGKAVERVQVGAGPAVVAPSPDGVWVTLFDGASVWHLVLG
jgi:streptogramin lyase